MDGQCDLYQSESTKEKIEKLKDFKEQRGDCKESKIIKYLAGIIFGLIVLLALLGLLCYYSRKQATWEKMQSRKSQNEQELQ